MKIRKAMLSLVVLLCAFAFFYCEAPIIPNTEGFVDKGERILGIDISQTGVLEYYTGLELVKDEFHIEVIDLHFTWDMLEGETEGDYSPMYDFIYLDQYYGNSNVKAALTLAVIDTNKLTAPSYLDNTSFEDMVTPFNNLIDKLFYYFPNMMNNDVVALSIGNEVDAYLSASEEWADWEEFYTQTSNYIKTINDQIPLGSKITVGAVLGDEEANSVALNEYTDAVMLTYYPINSDFTVRNYDIVYQDFDTLSGLFTYDDIKKDIYMLEVGYPSSEICLSSQEYQALFFEEVFKAWDNHKDQYKMMIFSWLSDLSQESLVVFENQYEISDEKFLEYLKTLGFLTYDGSEKLCFNFIKEHSLIRGW